MSAAYSTFDTPVGPISAAIAENGAVIATAFGDLPVLCSRLPGGAPALIRDDHRLRALRDQVLAYFRGERVRFELPLAPQGTGFQQRVWSALKGIPYGTTWSYARLAAELGSGPRAVGGANAANPVCLLLPCHRVIGSNGSLTGFAFGTRIKEQLLKHEARVAGRLGVRSSPLVLE